MASPAASPEEYGPRAGFLVPLPQAERGAASVIATSPDGKYVIYTNKTNVIVRSLEDPTFAFVYGEHSATVRVAKFAPTGKYVASGDTTGKVRVWAFTTRDHNLKFECAALGGEVEDLAWDSESKRILAVGGGTTRAKVFAWDTGSNLGEIIPHSKKAITGDIKPTRPFKLVTGSEDFALHMYAGPPFKYDSKVKEHTNFVNCVRYSPDGTRFASVSSDRTGIIYDASSGAVIGKLDAASGHAGAVFHVAWSADSTRIATASADKTVKVWDVTGSGPSFPCVSTFTLGAGVEDMQASVAWPTPSLLVSLSLDGRLNLLNAADATAAPVRVCGHQADACVMDVDVRSGRIVTGDIAGRVCVWTPVNDERSRFAARIVGGDMAPKKISGVALGGDGVAAVSWDDKLRVGDAVTGEFKAAVALPGQPKGVAVSGADPSVRVVVTGAAIIALRDASVTCQVDAPWRPTCVDVSRDGTHVAVGGEDKKLRVYVLSAGGASLTLEGESKELPAAVSVVAFSPDGTAVATGDALREVRVYDAATRDARVAHKWTNHTTRVTGAKWSPNGRYIASVSTDRRVCIWDPTADAPKAVFDLAHPQPFVACGWAADDVLWTLGGDGVATRRVLTL